MKWDVENHLVQVNGGNYLYDADGIRVRATEGSTTKYYINRYYEVDGNGNVTKYYFFGDQRVAMRKNSTLYVLHADHLGSTAAATRSGSTTRSTYYAFGGDRNIGEVNTDYQYTGQKKIMPAYSTTMPSFV